jgi:hypothetical protein
VVCVPLAWSFGIDGFCWGLLGVNLVRLVLCIALAYLKVDRRAANNDN